MPSPRFSGIYYRYLFEDYINVVLIQTRKERKKMHGGQDIHQNLASEDEVEFVLNLFPKIHFSYEWARSCQFLFSFLFCVLNATESKGKNLYFLFLCEVSHYSPLVSSKMNNSNFTDMNKMLYIYPLKFEIQVLVLSHAETFNTFIFYVYLFFLYIEIFWTNI